MKKSILLLTASALLSLGMLGSCNEAEPAVEPSSSSEVVDPEADWPVHAWSDAEIAKADAKLGAGVMAQLPFYYIKDQTVTDVYFERSFVMSVVGGEGANATQADVDRYGIKLLAAGFDPVSGYGAGRYRKELSKSYQKTKYLDVHVYLEGGVWNVDFMVGEALNDHSFPGRDSESASFASQLNDVSEAVVEFFDNYDLEGLVLPTSLAGTNNFNRVDFIDYGPQVYNYYADYYDEQGYFIGYYLQYIHVAESALELDATAPMARLVLTSSAKTEEAINNDKAAYLAGLTESGEGKPAFSYLTHRDPKGEMYEGYRNETSGFECELSVTQYSATASQANVASVSVLFSNAKFHDYSGLYENADNPAAASEELFGTIADDGFLNKYFENTENAFAFTDGVNNPGAKFSADVTDLRPLAYEYMQMDYAYLGLEITDLFATRDAIIALFRDEWGWIYVPKDEADEDSYEHLTYASEGLEATIESFTAAVADDPETTDKDESAPSVAAIEIIKIAA